MRFLLLILSMVFWTDVSAQELEKVRKEYYLAINNGKAADGFNRSLKQKAHLDPVYKAYFGSSQALKARFAFNPYNKLTYLSEGLKTLKSAVEQSPNDLEIRFLRFSLVHFIPSFLGYGDTLEPDKRKILELIQKKQFGSVDGALLKNVISFMKETKRCSPLELKILDQAVENG